MTESLLRSRRPLVLLYVDNSRKNGDRLDFARIWVLMKSSDEFSESVKLKLVGGVVLEIKVKYEWKPPMCPHYKMFGHDSNTCKLKPKVLLRLL